MSTITTIASGDQVSASRAVINTNFSNLNADKSEVSTGAYASASAAAAGNLYLPTDSRYVMRDTGAAFAMWGPICKLTQPPLSGWTEDANGDTGASLVTTGGVMQMTLANASGGSARWYRTAPSTPYTIDFLFLPAYDHSIYTVYGVGFRQSSTGKYVLFDLGWDTASSNPFFATAKWTDAKSFSANYTVVSTARVLAAVLYSHPAMWFRITDNGTNLLFYYSTDGNTWVPYDTRARTDFLLTTGPDQFAVGIRSATAAAGQQIGATLIHMPQS